jgi:ATPase subunit of ABC transporter with duplicated ATPase domains
LDSIVTDIVRLEDRKLYYFEGNYSKYEHTLKEMATWRAEMEERKQDKIADEKKKIQDMQAGAKKTGNDALQRQAKERQQKLTGCRKTGGHANTTGAIENRVGLEHSITGGKFKYSNKKFFDTSQKADQSGWQVTLDSAVHFNLTAAGQLGFHGALLQCKALSIGYSQDNPFCNPFDLNIDMESRIAVLGVNGSGKSTFLKTLAGKQSALRGEVYTYPKLVVAYFSQEVADELPYDITPVDALKSHLPEATAQQIRSHLGSFGIKHQATQELRTLSGGERVRVALARTTIKPPHVLLLDEPTNHLDLMTVEGLSEGLRVFKGGVVLTSHDRRLITDVAKDCYLLNGGKFAASSMNAFLKRIKHV